MLTNHYIINDVAYDVSTALEVNASSDVVMEETFAEQEAVDGSILAQNASSNVALEEHIAGFEATKEPVLVRETSSLVHENINDTEPMDAPNNIEDNILQNIAQSSKPAANETPDLWLKLLRPFLLAFFSQRLMLDLLQSPMLVIVLIMSLLVYISNGRNGCAEQQMADYACGPQNQHQAKFRNCMQGSGLALA
jgi:hypothetical protein